MPTGNDLAQVLASGSTTEQLAAAEQLAHLGDEAQPAAVALVESLDSEDEALRDWVVAALEGLGPPSTKDVAALAKLTTSTGIDVAYWATTLLGRLGADAAPSTGSLTKALESHPDLVVRERAALALGKIGPGAASAMQALEQAAGSADARLSKLAGEAIELIGS
jgi:HEAT repeat protein